MTQTVPVTRGPAALPPSPPGPRAATVWWNRSLAGIAGLGMLVLGYHTRWICDDALIYTRAVREILVGNGPVFSPGERAETSTSTLWQWLLALCGLLTGRQDTSGLSWMLGLALSTLGTVLAVHATGRLHRRLTGTGPAGERLLLPVGVLALLAVRPVWEYATSGLETGLITLWIALCWWQLVRLHGRYAEPAEPEARTAAEPDEPDAAAPAIDVPAAAPGSRWGRGPLLWMCLVAGLGPLVRPDLALLTCVMLVAAWLLARPGRRLLTAGVAVAGALPAGYEVFRMGYYGVLFPLPAITKEAGASEWARGWEYLVDLVGAYWLVIPVLAVLTALGCVVARRPGRADRVVLLAPPAAGLLMTVYVTKVGGDYMHARMLLPALFTLLLPALVLPATRRVLPFAAVVAVWFVVCFGWLRFPHPTLGERIDDERAYYVEFTGKAYPVRTGDFLPRMTVTAELLRRELDAGRRSLLYYAPSEHIRMIAVPLDRDVDAPLAVIGGYLGAGSAVAPPDARVVDFLGLAYPVGARMQFTRPGQKFTEDKTGHRKPLSNVWLLADYADPRHPVDPSGNFAIVVPVTPEAVAAARHALGCGALKELQESVRAPMSPGRFWANLTGAWDRTQLRIPADPFEAERKFCGSLR